MVDLMVDLETMGNQFDACIVQIGACFFDPRNGLIGGKYYTNVDLQSCIDVGLSVSGDTVYWWLQQNEQARKSITTGKKIPIEKAMKQFAKFAKDAKRVWSHSGFDFAIIQTAFQKTKIKSPFHYRAPKDLRTLTYLADIDTKDFPRVGVEHDALSDCVYQTSYASTGIQKIAVGNSLLKRITKPGETK